MLKWILELLKQKSKFLGITIRKKTIKVNVRTNKNCIFIYYSNKKQSGNEEHN